ncbi:Trypsin inhibitor [Melia azedarach]|uniref:Trypsin inhibitor n=1 Tax=Melia azedarach TaxID=155640 RepID=A0ACC1XQQ6_MELAZ|nr:Trypsin inhibitor [Melia azedarach]
MRRKESRVTAIWGAGGDGLSLHSGRNSLCPLNVIQESFDLERGIRINFSPFDNSIVVRESTDLNIKFLTLITSCNKQPVWKVDNYDDSRGKWFISTGGEEGNPGAHTLQNWFKLERIGSNAGIYKIVHCPSVCESCVKLCNNVGISYVDGARRLVLVPDEEPALAVVLFLAKDRSNYA